VICIIKNTDILLLFVVADNICLSVKENLYQT